MTRVVSLLPAATEIVAALGESSTLVGISHECDYPESIRGLPRVTTTSISGSATSGEIDAAVRTLQAAGRPVIAVDAEQIRALGPDLILTQGLCEVCAVAEGEVHRLSSALEHPPRVLPLSGRDLAGIWRDIREVGVALGASNQAQELVRSLEARLETLAGQRPSARARVLCLEWLDPPYLAGHWVPELVQAAGGQAVGTSSGRHSSSYPWSDLAALEPDQVVVMLCGFEVHRARQELERLDDPVALQLLQRVPTWIIDGNAYTSRPGPRLVDGAFRIHSALVGHPMTGVERWEPATIC